jgi:hypothetical protein
MRGTLNIFTCLSGILITLSSCGSEGRQQQFAGNLADSNVSFDDSMSNVVPPAPPPPAPNYAPALEAALQADQQTSGYGMSSGRVTAMRAIDLSQTPADFREAYLEHIFAWERRVRADQAWKSLNTEQNNRDTLAGGVVCALLDCNTNPIDSRLEAEERLKQEIQAASQEISATFQEVQRVAVRYGANPTPSSSTPGM